MSPERNSFFPRLPKNSNSLFVEHEVLCIYLRLTGPNIIKSLSQLAWRSLQIEQNSCPLLATGLRVVRQNSRQTKSQSGPAFPSDLRAQALHVLTIPLLRGTGTSHTYPPPKREQRLTLHFLTRLTTRRHFPEFGWSAAGNPKSRITHVSPFSHGTGGIRLPAVEHTSPFPMHPIPSSIQHSWASNKEIGSLHFGFASSTGPNILKLDSQLALCSKHRLQNSSPLLATSRGTRHSWVQISGHRTLGRSVRVAHASHVATNPDTLHMASAPPFVHNVTEQLFGISSTAVHSPVAGISINFFPKFLITHVNPLPQLLGGSRPPIRHVSPSPRPSPMISARTAENTTTLTRIQTRIISQILRNGSLDYKPFTLPRSEDWCELIYYGRRFCEQ